MADYSEPTAKITEIEGINNRAEARTLAPSELIDAANYDLDDRKRLRRRPGFVQRLAATSSITSAWSTIDQRRMFVIDGGVLNEFVGHSAYEPLASGFPADEAYFADAKGRFFVSCGDKLGFIRDKEYQDLAVPIPLAPELTYAPGTLPKGRYAIVSVHEAPDGRQGPASAILEINATMDNWGLAITALSGATFPSRVYVSRADGTAYHYLGTVDPGGTIQLQSLDQLNTQFALDEQQFDTLPPPDNRTGPIAYFEAKLWVAVSDTDDSKGYVFPSKPYWFHVFDLVKDGITVLGRVEMLVGTDTGLLIGTTKRLYLYRDGVLNELGDFGVVPGQNYDYAYDGRVIVFWSEEGLCQFSGEGLRKLTEARLLTEPGVRVAVGVAEKAEIDQQAIVVTALGAADVETVVLEFFIAEQGDGSQDKLLLEDGTLLLLED